MPFVTFEKKGRTGNNLFQYLMCKVISLQWGHTYIPIEELPQFIPLTPPPVEETMDVVEDNAQDILDGNIPHIRETHLICRAYFQHSKFFVPVRDLLLKAIRASNDYWFNRKGEKIYIQSILSTPCPVAFKETDIVMNLRLDDFIQLPCKTSDILHPLYYLEQIETWKEKQPDGRLFIVCDKLNYPWEHHYLECFKKWQPIMLQNDIIMDCAAMREAPLLIHSNSTLCWIMSFLSTATHRVKKRIIPITHFYKGQDLRTIEPGDELVEQTPLTHDQVYNIRRVYKEHLLRNIHPHSYCIPDEWVIPEIDIERKTAMVSNNVPLPGQEKNKPYPFTYEEQDKYHQTYQCAYFANTKKKGGWDCLRHYEILANGCIPLFENLEACPSHTMTPFPKELIREATQQLRPPQLRPQQLQPDINSPPPDTTEYLKYARLLLDYTRTHLTTSVQARSFLDTMQTKTGKPIHHVLMLGCHPDIHYTRELLWIGLTREMERRRGTTTEYPPQTHLYEDYPRDKNQLYGRGFTYACRLPPKTGPGPTYDEIQNNIQKKFYDLILYGKIGPDEFHEGTIPRLPYWQEVFQHYNQNQIVFLYGGDEMNDLTQDNRYHDHLMRHAAYGQCFVRELNM